MKRTHRNPATLSVLMGVLATATVLIGCGGTKSGSDAAAGGSGGNMSGSAAGGRDAGAGASGGSAGQASGGTTSSARTTSGGAGMGGQSLGGRVGSGGSVGPNGGSTSAAGGSSTTTSSSTAAAGPACRTYATAYTFESSLGARYKYTCSHNETADGFDRMCKQSTTTDTEHWASKSDFIDEAAAVGLSKLMSSTRDYPAFRTEYNYDAQGRLTAIMTGATPYETYDQWDDLKRPLHGVLGPSCENAESTQSYTERTRSVNTATGICAQNLTMTFDDDGIVTFVDYGNGTTATYTTTSRATVCR